MTLSKDDFPRTIEEFKELGHELRYRDQIMVQEFSLSMIAAGVALGALAARWSSPVGITIQIFGAAFMGLLTLHLRNVNEDRLAALRRKEELRVLLNYGLVHQNLGGTRRWSAPKLMMRFTGAVAIAWTAWTALTIAALVGATGS